MLLTPKSDGLNVLGRRLSINHYNLSVAEQNPDGLRSKLNPEENGGAPGSDVIFHKDLYNKEWVFERNILIIGAGASYDSFNFIGAGERIIRQMNIDLRIKERYEKGYEEEIYGGRSNEQNLEFKDKCLEIAGIYNRKVYDPNTEWDIVEHDLGFEGGLHLLLNFFTKDYIVDQLRRRLGFKHLPSYFYEIVSHMFKHRFFDVIVNFNFDEILDNAIEDEMCGATYHKVVSDIDIHPFSEFTTENRLKAPIYIKPHGSASSKSSMLFTSAQYVTISQEMRTFLKEVFLGTISSRDPGTSIKNINICVAGYSLRDIDIQNILFNQIESKQVKNIRYFVFNTEPIKAMTNFESNFLQHIESKTRAKIKPNTSESKLEFSKSLEDQKRNYESKCTFYEIPVTTVENDFENTLTGTFQRLYNENVRKQFKSPFEPPPLFRHEFISIFFPKTRLEKQIVDFIKPKASGDVGSAEYARYLESRLVNSLVFDLFKHGGKLLKNDLDVLRFSKYLRLIGKYRNKEYTYSTWFEEANIDLAFSAGETYLIDTDFETKSFDQLYSKYIKLLRQYSFIGTDTEFGNENKAREILLNAFKKGGHEVTYNFETIKVDKRADFSAILGSQILTTNLALTWYFYKYSVNRMQEWDTLYLSSKSLKAFFNLYTHCEKKDENGQKYLERILKEKKIYIKYERDSPVSYGNDPSAQGAFDAIYDLCKIVGAQPPELILCTAIENRMALYYKGELPLFGLYYFKSQSSHISPVIFETRKSLERDNYKNIECCKMLWRDIGVRKKDS